MPVLLKRAVRRVKELDNGEVRSARQQCMYSTPRNLLALLGFVVVLQFFSLLPLLLRLRFELLQ